MGTARPALLAVTVAAAAAALTACGGSPAAGVGAASATTAATGSSGAVPQSPVTTSPSTAASPVPQQKGLTYRTAADLLAAIQAGGYHCTSSVQTLAPGAVLGSTSGISCNFSPFTEVTLFGLFPTHAQAERAGRVMADTDDPLHRADDAGEELIGTNWVAACGSVQQCQVIQGIVGGQSLEQN